MKLLKITVAVIFEFLLWMSCSGCKMSDFHAPRYGVPQTAGGGVGYSSTVIQTVLVVNESHHDVSVEFPQFSTVRVGALSTARMNIRVTEYTTVAFVVTYFREDGRKIKLETGRLYLEPTYDTSSGQAYRGNVPSIVIPPLAEDYLRRFVQ